MKHKQLIVGMIFLSSLNLPMNSLYLLNSLEFSKYSLQEMYQPPHIVSTNEQAIILQKPNAKLKKASDELAPQKSPAILAANIAKLEKKPTLNSGTPSTTFFGQQLKSLSGTLLYGTKKG